MLRSLKSMFMPIKTNVAIVDAEGLFPRSLEIE